MTTPDLIALQADIKAEFSNFSIAVKQDSALMKFIAVFLPASFMTDFVTTIHDTSYVPRDWASWGVAGQCVVLRHERIHMRQAKKWTFPLFAFLYLCVFLPIGLAYARAKFEMEAYTETLAAQKDYGEDYACAKNRAWLLSMFTGPAYGYMWPFTSALNTWIDSTIVALRSKLNS